MLNELKILGRSAPLFDADLSRLNDIIDEKVNKKRFLIIGGGGSIGRSVAKQIYCRMPSILHLVDISENYLAETVREIRSSIENTATSFDAFCIDCGDDRFFDFMQNYDYDYVLNLSAMKHVRSENHALSMKRMIETNIINSMNILNNCKKIGAKNYFCVSTDKAANPVNFMGATKRAMELCLFQPGSRVVINSARFANVAFSNGSLLEGFEQRVKKNQPLSVPVQISRYFITQTEAGIICMLSAILGESNRVYFPSNKDEIQLQYILEVAERFIESLGLEPVVFHSEDEAREAIKYLDLKKYWPLNVFSSDTVGEKHFEEFHTEMEIVKEDQFTELSSVSLISEKSDADISFFIEKFYSIDPMHTHARNLYIRLIQDFVENFAHTGGNRYLNSRM